MKKYVIYVHTRSIPDGFIHTGFLWNTGHPIFSSIEEAEDYIMKESLGWRWNGYCTIREYNGEFD